MAILSMIDSFSTSKGTRRVPSCLWQQFPEVNILQALDAPDQFRQNGGIAAGQVEWCYFWWLQWQSCRRAEQWRSSGGSEWVCGMHLITYGLVCGAW